MPWVIVSDHLLNQDGQGMVGLGRVSWLLLGGFGKEELLPRGRSTAGLNLLPLLSQREGSFDKGVGGKKTPKSWASSVGDSVGGCGC